ncbi:MAG: methyltransferase domain-containing protein [Bacteroidetes bacterium]|nr:methyltransferase domain-containing protein [Bacteroidota bacterium]
MENDRNYLIKNKEAWNLRTAVHVGSRFYDMPAFMSGATSLQSIELDMLGSVAGKKILHLQCHFGQDSLSLARMGARVTGIDLSDVAIEKARELNHELKLDAEFICCDVYSLPENLNVQFDIVFTTYGTIGWLPDMDRWASVVSHFLKPGGELVFVEFHPVVWMFDEGFRQIDYNYFNEKPIEETSSGTYTDPDAPLRYETVSWNHSLSEVMQALIRQGLNIRQFKEYDYSPYNCFQNMVEVAEHRFRIKHIGNKMPMVYSILAVK